MSDATIGVNNNISKTLVDMGDSTHAERVVSSPPPVTPTDRSGMIATGGTPQILAAAKLNRRGFWIQNLSSADLWVSTIGAAAAQQGSMRIPAGALYETPLSGCPTGAISVFGATTGQAFTAREF